MQLLYDGTIWSAKKPLNRMPQMIGEFVQNVGVSVGKSINYGGNIFVYLFFLRKNNKNK